MALCHLPTFISEQMASTNSSPATSSSAAFSSLLSCGRALTPTLRVPVSRRPPHVGSHAQSHFTLETLGHPGKQRSWNAAAPECNDPDPVSNVGASPTMLVPPRFMLMQQRFSTGSTDVSYVEKRRECKEERE